MDDSARTAPPAPTVLLEAIVLGESPRWHDGRLWFCDWGREEVVSVGLDGKRATLEGTPPAPWSIAWHDDGRLLFTSAGEMGAQLTARDRNGTVESIADLSDIAERHWNEIVIDTRGNVFLDAIGFDLMAGEAPRAGLVAVVTPDGRARRVADDVHFPNGMAVTADGATLIVAESYGQKLTAFDIAADGGLSNRRVWADLDGGAPDGICLDAEGAVWYADVPNQRCVRVREGGQVLQTIELDRGCFACMLGGPDNRTLFVMAAEWRGPASMADGARTGQVLTAPAPAPGAGWP
jgi:sugar lactone lactonase YvrE